MMFTLLEKSKEPNLSKENFNDVGDAQQIRCRR